MKRTLLLLLFALLGACGYKGPLTLPSKTAAQPASQPSPSAAEPSARKEGQQTSSSKEPGKEARP